MNIGRNPSYGEYFGGAIDEVTVYNRALSADEIQAIFAAGSAGKAHTTLQTSSPLPTSGWANEGATPAVVNGRYSVTNIIGTSPRFYRLIK